MLQRDQNHLQLRLLHLLSSRLELVPAVLGALPSVLLRALRTARQLLDDLRRRSFE